MQDTQYEPNGNEKVREGPRGHRKMRKPGDRRPSKQLARPSRAPAREQSSVQMSGSIPDSPLTGKL